MRVIVTWPEDAPTEWRDVWGLGRFERGKPRTLDLSAELLIILRFKGFVVEEARPARGRQEVNDGT